TPSCCCTERTDSGDALEYTSTGCEPSCGTAQASASLATSRPEAICSGSTANAGRPRRRKSATCSLVATEQLPETTALAPCAGDSAPALGENDSPWFCGSPMATPEPATTSGM